MLELKKFIVVLICLIGINLLLPCFASDIGTKSIDLKNKSLNLSNENLEYFNKSASSKLLKKDYTGAIEDCTKAIAIDPKGFVVNSL